jgi:DNA-binding NarL/FixJ family response regulator
MAITIAVADDHRLFLKSLSALIENYQGLSIVAEAVNGTELIERLNALPALPDIIIIDVNMPNMDGETATIQIKQKHPEAKVVALSMKDDDRSIIKMIRAGCCAYLLKDIHPDELEKALHEIHKKGSYNADTVNINYRRLLQYTQQEEAMQINEKEMRFLQLACSDLTYKQIASDLNVSERTVDSYRESLFQKMNVQSRVGMALEAVRRNLVKL